MREYDSDLEGSNFVKWLSRPNKLSIGSGCFSGRAGTSFIEWSDSDEMLLGRTSTLSSLKHPMSLLMGNACSEQFCDLAHLALTCIFPPRCKDARRTFSKPLYLVLSPMRESPPPHLEVTRVVLSFLLTCRIRSPREKAIKVTAPKWCCCRIRHYKWFCPCWAVIASGA